ncbi:MAG: hypothetical protein ABS976_19190, partial [Rhodococcus sp. (in: high G+C Gram-positive bacteria)]
SIPGSAGVLLFSNVADLSITNVKVEKGAPFAIHVSNARNVFISDIAVETLVLVSQEMARQLVTEPIARGGMRLTMEIGSIQGPIEQPYLDWIEAIKQVATQAAEAGDIVPGTDIDALARFVVGSFTGVQILSEMLTGRTDLYERLSQMWNLVLPTIVREDKLAHVMQLAALAPREWEPPSV